MKNYDVLFCRNGTTDRQRDDVIEEEALQIMINKREFSMTMRTPGADRYLVRGLLHGSGIANSNFLSFEEEQHIYGACVRAEIAGEAAESNRLLMSTSSCGICGERNLDNLFSGLKKIEKNISFDAYMIPQYYENLSEHQILFQATGGSHAAGAFNCEGKLLCAFEDIGRHNAVDKVIGWLLENDQLAQADVLAVSSRISFEIVQKCIRAGIPVLTGISAPSSLAIETARHFDLTMAAFCRGQQATFYAGGDKVTAPSAPRISVSK
jgi:FdhD protein